MLDTDTLQQLQTRIAEMERHHEEELKKLKADHDQLEARMKRPQGEECSSHTMPECTQGESYPQHTVNT